MPKSPSKSNSKQKSRSLSLSSLPIPQFVSKLHSPFAWQAQSQSQSQSQSPSLSSTTSASSNTSPPAGSTDPSPPGHDNQTTQTTTTTTVPSYHPTYHQSHLTPTQKTIYSLESEENFRWIARLLPTRSSHVLGPSELVRPEVVKEIDEWGQFAEMAHGSVDPRAVWKKLGMRNGLESGLGMDVLEGYWALAGGSIDKVGKEDEVKVETQTGVVSGPSSAIANDHDTHIEIKNGYNKSEYQSGAGTETGSGPRLVSVFHGKVADLQAYIAHRVVLVNGDEEDVGNSIRNEDVNENEMGTTTTITTTNNDNENRAESVSGSEVKFRILTDAKEQAEIGIGTGRRRRQRQRQRRQGQLIVAFSGTSKPIQALKDVDARMIVYPFDKVELKRILESGESAVSPPESPDPEPASKSRSDPFINSNSGSQSSDAIATTTTTFTSILNAKVHNGFWSIFTGIKDTVLNEIAKALAKYDVDELVLTGHSLGATQAFLLSMDLLKDQLLRYHPTTTTPTNHTAKVDATAPYIRLGIKIRVVAFGSPRIGNAGLVSLYRLLLNKYRTEHGQDAFRDYSVKGYNDGVHCLPPKFLGYRHLAESSYYLYHGNLYTIPPSESEASIFPVCVEADAPPPAFPLGGHNYYNNRDMEGTLRVLRQLNVAGT